MFRSTDISYVLSGGTYNSDPNQSLGGESSATPVGPPFDNLFNDIDIPSSTQTDYRCIYIFNDNLTDSLTNTEIFIASIIPGGSTISLGFKFAQDVQQITISGNPQGGSISFSYENYEFSAEWTSDPTVMASTIQSQLIGIYGLSFLKVTGLDTQGIRIITITFLENKYQPLVALISNDLYGSSSISISIQKIQDGAPINQIAPLIPNSAVTPGNVSFSYPTEDNPISIGYLRPLDGFPVWVMRTTTSGAQITQPDGFSLEVSGYPQSEIQLPPPPPNIFTYTMTGGLTIAGSALIEIQNWYYETTGGITISGEASTMSQSQEYTFTGYILISGSAIVYNNTLICPQLCSSDGMYCDVYWLNIYSITYLTPLDPDCSCSELQYFQSESPPNCCDGFNSSFALVYNPETCFWENGDPIEPDDAAVKWTLHHDPASGTWTLEGSVNYCAQIVVQWSSSQWLGCGLNNSANSINGIQFKGCQPITGYSDAAVLSLYPACYNALAYTGIYYYPYDPSNPGDNMFCPNSPCKQINCAIYECGSCCCCPKTFKLTVTVTSGTPCPNDSGIYNLIRGDYCTWVTENIVGGAYYTLTASDIEWTLTSAQGTTGTISVDSFDCCGTNTFTLNSCGAVLSVTLAPIDCVSSAMGGGVLIGGSAHYVEETCILCIDGNLSSYPEVYFQGFNGLPGDGCSYVNAVPGNIFPIYIGRRGGMENCSCSVQVVTYPTDCGTTLQRMDASHPDCNSGANYQDSDPNVTFACGQDQTNIGISICSNSPPGVVVYCFQDPVGCTIAPECAKFSVFVS